MCLSQIYKLESRGMPGTKRLYFFNTSPVNYYEGTGLRKMALRKLTLAA